MSSKLLLGFIVLYSALKMILNVNSTNTITILDVGNADSIVINIADLTVLIDGGSSYDTLYKLSYFIDPCAVDLVILTHPHKDHLSGLYRIAKLCKKIQIISPLIEYESTLFRKWSALVAGMDFHAATNEEKLSLEGVDLYILWPPSNFSPSNVNNVSTVILLDSGKFEALFMGDLESDYIGQIPIEDYMYLIDGGVDLYKVSHHGASNGLDKEFLRKIMPKVSVITTGDNSYGHPNEEVIEFLESIGSKIYRSDLDGNISVKF